MVIGLVRKALSKPRPPKGFSRGCGAGGTRRAVGTALAALSGSTSSFVNPFTTSLQNYPPLREKARKCKTANSHIGATCRFQRFLRRKPGRNAAAAQDLYVRHGRQKARALLLERGA